MAQQQFPPFKARKQFGRQTGGLPPRNRENVNRVLLWINHDSTCVRAGRQILEGLGDIVCCHGAHPKINFGVSHF